MSWIEFKFHTTRAAAAELEALLEANGAVSVTMMDAEDKPLFEPGVGETPLWDNLSVTGLFTENTDTAHLQKVLSAAWFPLPLPTLQISTLAEQNWVRAWLDDFKPMCFGRRLWVCPTWWLASKNGNCAGEWSPLAADAAEWESRNHELLNAMQKSGTTIMQLDPGMAFGTGTHPTTALCLQWLDAQPLRGLTLVDYGCGSGILGIAALLLGAQSVYGVDNDPQALVATHDNCTKNQLDSQRFPVYLPAVFAQALAAGTIKPVDGMMANILAVTLVQLAELLALQVKQGGWILLSGILCEQAATVVQAYTPWFRDFVIATENDWVFISAHRL